MLLLVAWRLPHADVTGIEAQADRAAMGRRSIAYNGVADRCRILDGDLRELPRADVAAGFDLITGTPPYFPRGTGTESAKPHAMPCRFELRGGVEAYLAAAAEQVAPTGRIVICTAALERDRVDAAFASLPLQHDERWAIVPRAGKAPLVMVDALRVRAPGAPPAPCAVQTLTVRDGGGAWTEAFQVVRADLGLPTRPPTG